MSETQQLEVHLKRDSLLIETGQPSIGELVVMIKNRQPEPINCELIKIEIPVGEAGDINALTDSNNFMINPDDWSVASPPFPLVDQFVVLNMINDFGIIPKRERFVFHIYKLPILPNPEGTDIRSVKVGIKFFETTTSTEPFLTETLTLELKNQPKTDPKPFVQYFAIDRYFISQGEILNLSWSIVHPKDMRLYPNFLSDQDEKKGPRIRGMRSDQDRQPIDILSEAPIRITQPVGSLQVRLVKSTEFRLVADNEGKEGTSQIIAFIKSLTIIFFRAKGLNLKQPVKPGDALVLEWLITFTNPKDADNQVYLISQEFDNKGEIRSPRPDNPRLPISGTKVTKVWKLPNERKGAFIVYPTQPTNYVLYIYQSSNPFNKTYPIPVMINVPNSPLGSVVMFSGQIADIPYGWALCDGKVYTKEDYANHWRAVYQAQFGTLDADYDNYLDQSYGDLIKTLQAISPNNGVKLPDLRNQFVAGAGKDYQLHQTGGSKEVTLSVEQIPEHNHSGATTAAGAHRHNILRGSGKLGYDYGGQKGTKTVSAGGDHKNPATLITDKAANHTHQIPTQGGGKAHENRPPFYALLFIIKVLK